MSFGMIGASIADGSGELAVGPATACSGESKEAGVSEIVALGVDIFALTMLNSGIYNDQAESLGRGSGNYIGQVGSCRFL